MREIKFRVYGGLLKKEFKAYDNVLLSMEGGILRIKPCDWHGKGDDVVLEQYAGLKDKNGKEIYEGDIIRCYDDDRFIAPVIRHDKSGGFCWDSCYDEKCFIPESDEVEVIGNIHENPELIGKEKEHEQN